MVPRLKQKFASEVAAKVKEQYKVVNPMALPRLDKIVLNVGMGRELEGTKLKAVAKDVGRDHALAGRLWTSNTPRNAHAGDVHL